MMEILRNATFSASSLKPMRPWSGFFQTASFRQPSNWTEVQSRFQHNLKYFQTNYLIILACLLGFCLLSNIFFLLAFVASGAALYFISKLPEDFSQNVQGIEVKPKHLQIVWAILSLILLYLTSAGTAIFWSIGVTAFVVTIHAVMHDISIESDFALPA